MTIEYERLKGRQFADLTYDLTDRDTILYALGVGLGCDPVDKQQLRFVYEEALAALPTMAVVLGHPGFWFKDPDTGVDWKRVLHGEQSLEIHRPLPTNGRIIGRTWIEEIIDKGPGKGALIYWNRTAIDEETGEPLCTMASTTFCRGDGGFGGPSGPTKTPHVLPDRPCDSVCDLPTLPQAALIYRLSGDYNPLHADPDVAQAGGFERPILHGLATFGVAGHALLKELCAYDTQRFRKMDVRFSSPVYPGETIRTEIWRDEPGVASFRCRVVERDAIVLNNGRFEYAA